MANKLSMGILTLPLNDGYSFNVYLMKKKHTNPNPFLSSDLCVLVEHTIEKTNPMFIFINGLFGCVFIRDRESEK